MGRRIILAIVGMLVLGALLVVVASNAAAEGTETGVFPNRTFTITRSPPGGPRSDTYSTPIVPTASGRWSVTLESITGSALIVQVYKVDGGVLVLEGSSKLRAVGQSSTPIPLFAGMTYSANFIPYGKAGPDILTEHFIENVAPIACFTYSPASPIAGQPVSFDGSCSTDSDGRIVAYDWDFGDASAGTGVTTTHTYASQGAYSVVLRVTDDFQAYDTDSQTITVAPPPVNNPPIALFTFTPSAPLVGEVVTFDGSASYDPDVGDSIVDYHWVWGDGGSGSSGTNPMAMHTYAAAGTYTVLLHVTDTGGLMGEASATLRVLAPPTAAFTFSPATPGVGAIVSFDASGSADVDGTIASYAWDFGDGSTGTGVTATHAYSAAGSYTVVLTVTDSDGLTATASQVVQVGLPPVASFFYMPALPLQGSLVSFDGSGSSDAEGPIVSYAWTFGDGSTGTGVTATHAYALYGTYTVTLTVTDTDGFTGSQSQSIRIAVGPVASFVFNPSTPRPADTVSFDASASTDADGTIVSYSWDFGDGSTGTGVTATHAYAVFGSYDVVLVVTDSDGLTGTMIRTVRVATAPTASFVYAPALPLQGTLVSFDGSGSSDAEGPIVSYAWTFGDGSTGTGVTATHAYALYGTYTVTLTVTDTDGFTGSQSQSIRIAVGPVASFVFNPLAPKVAETISFDASASTDADGTIASYAWAFGDGSTGTGVTATHAYAAFGSYNVVLVVTDSDGLSGTMTRTVRVFSAPTASFMYSPALPLQGASVSFDASASSDSDGTVVSYAWAFGDGSSGTGVTATHTYALYGTYAVALTVTDSDGLTNTATKSIRIAVGPTASFTFSPALPLQGAPVSFDGSGSSDPDGSIASYAWAFGDGSTGSGVTATHSFALYGSYNVVLVVTDSDGLTGTMTRTIRVASPPTASFVYSPALPLQGASVSFDGRGSSDADGTIASYAWAFGDGGTGSGATATHTYALYGTYAVALTVTDSDGLTNTATKSIRIAVGPVASFTFSPALPLQGAPVSFDGSGSSDPDGTIASYAWDFGDGSTGSGVTATHAYALYGSYNAVLVVTDSDGFTGTMTRAIRVASPPTASFVYTPALPLQGTSVSFDASASSDADGTIALYAWLFGDGSSGSGRTTSHVYAAFGTYTATLTVTDSDGLTATASKSIRIAAAPVAAFTFSPASPFVGDTVSFDASGSSDADGTIASYAWTFGDGSTGTGVSPTHAYTSAGPFTVQLTVTDSDGFTGTISHTVTVSAPNVPPTANFVFSPASPTVGEAVSFDGSSSSDSDGTIASYAWDFGDGSTGSGVTVSHAYASAATFHVTLTVTDDLGAPGSVTKDVIVGPAGPGEDWTFYDFFKVPYGEWWDIRRTYALTGDVPIGAECFSADAVAGGFWCIPSDPSLPDVASFPYTNWVKTPVGDAMVVAPYRFTANIRQNPAFTVERPVMLPRCDDLRAAAAAAGTTIVCPSTLPTGGAISLDEQMQYLTSLRATQLADRLCPDLTFLNDGFITELQATVTMDSTAALKLFGVTDPSEWAFGTSGTSLLKAGCGTGLLLDPSSGVLEKGLKAWFEAQGNGPYDIQSAFGAPFSVFAIEASGSYDSVSGKHTLVLDIVAWGHETLFARWAYWGAATYAGGLGGAAPTGWWGMEMPWTENVRFAATFGATSFDAQASGAIQYHFRASGEPGADTLWYTSDDVAKWVWQPVLGDRYPGTPLHPASELGASTAGTFYVGQTYIHTTPASRRYGTAYAYDYVPAIWQLKTGETQTFQFPTTAVVLYDPYLSGRTDSPRALVPISAGIVLGSSVPATGVGTYDALTNTLRVVGPISVGTYPTVPSGKPAESRPIYNLVRAP